MNRDRFLDVNGFNVEYDIPLEKRLNKYRKPAPRESARAIVPETEKLNRQSLAWRSRIRRRQVVTAIVAGVAFVCIVVLAWYLTFGF